MHEDDILPFKQVINRYKHVFKLSQEDKTLKRSIKMKPRYYKTQFGYRKVHIGCLTKGALGDAIREGDDIRLVVYNNIPDKDTIDEICAICGKKETKEETTEQVFWPVIKGKKTLKEDKK